MNIPIKVTIDTQTGEVTETPLTAEEIAQSEADAIVVAAKEAELAAELAAKAALKESTKAKLIAGEPLTEEEAALIVL